jgi:hypothetical protein
MFDFIDSYMNTLEYIISYGTISSLIFSFVITSFLREKDFELHTFPLYAILALVSVSVITSINQIETIEPAQTILFVALNILSYLFLAGLFLYAIKSFHLERRLVVYLLLATWGFFFLAILLEVAHYILFVVRKRQLAKKNEL